MRWLFPLAAAALTLAAIPAGATEYGYVRAGDGGRMLCGAAPPEWRSPDLEDASWGLRDARCRRRHRLRRHPVRALALRRRPRAPRLATTTLRIRYSHGFAAYLNGTEIARRRLDPRADAAALATEYHGPEAERVFVPVRPGLLRASGNVLVHRGAPAHRRQGAVRRRRALGADGARIVRGPYLQRLNEREVTVVFDTDLPTVGEVRWGLDEGYGRLITDAPPQTHHALRLTGLLPGKSYHYKVSVRATPAAVASAEGLPLMEGIHTPDVAFHTPPESGKPLRFAVYGDVRSGHDVHALLNQRLPRKIPTWRSSPATS